MKIFVGLGNPGEEYGPTRHNVGWRVLDCLRKTARIREEYPRRLYRAWEAAFNGHVFLLLKPKTYMNESGRAVKAALDAFHSFAEDLVLIHDDMDLPVGKMKITTKRGPGGHKGVISVIGETGTDELVRVRIGIGRSAERGPYTDHVLSAFETDEEPLVGETVAKAAEACREMVVSGQGRAMTHYNR